MPASIRDVVAKDLTCTLDEVSINPLVERNDRKEVIDNEFEEFMKKTASIEAHYEYIKPKLATIDER
jgi:hypothetical protein